MSKCVIQSAGPGVQVMSTAVGCPERKNNHYRLLNINQTAIFIEHLDAASLKCLCGDTNSPGFVFCLFCVQRRRSFYCREVYMRQVVAVPFGFCLARQHTAHEAFDSLKQVRGPYFDFDCMTLLPEQRTSCRRSPSV